MNIKLMTLMAAGLLLASCGPKGTEPPKADNGTVTQPALPYDATGNWGIKFVGSQPNKPDTVLDFMSNPMGIPLPATITMLNKVTGDFRGTITYQGQTYETITGNTKTGAVHVNSFLTSPDNINLWFYCSGQFNATLNTYTGVCEIDPATSTPEEVSNWQAAKANGAKMTLQLTKL